MNAISSTSPYTNASVNSSGGGSKEEVVVTEPDTCFCCCAAFNKSTKTIVKCCNSECHFVVCKECVRTYLLSTTQDPHCMECNSAWTQQFIVSQLNRSFLTGSYKTHRKNLLLERELSKMPETMNAAMVYKDIEELERQDKEINQTKKDLRAQLVDIKNEQRRLYNKIWQLRRGGKKEDKETRKFILPCPDEHCRGFLSTAYKCEICKMYACSKCLTMVGEERVGPDHICNPDMVKTANLIRETTRPCPSCGERITKASGCNQMWCTGCRTAFCWKTGNIDKGVVHNPHYYQYQQQVNNGIVPRNPGDVACGGLPDNRWAIRNTIRRVLLDKLDKEIIQCTCNHIVENNGAYKVTIEGENNTPIRLYHTDLSHNYMELHRMVNHITHYELDDTRNTIRELADFERIRVQYILGMIDKPGMATDLLRKDNTRRKHAELLHIYELISVVGIEMINHISTTVLTEPVPERPVLCAELTKKYTEFRQFIDYVNYQFKIISVTYSQTVIQIDQQFICSTEKFKISDL